LKERGGKGGEASYLYVMPHEGEKERGGKVEALSSCSLKRKKERKGITPYL